MDIEPVNSGSFFADKSDILKYLAEKYKLEFSGSKFEVVEYLNTNYPLTPKLDTHRVGDRYVMENFGTHEEQIERYNSTNPFADGTCILYFMEITDIKKDTDNNPKDVEVSIEVKAIKIKINN
jgi:hypothetical protein